jgi:hypothetical protein
MEIVHIVLKVIREAMLSLAFLGTGTIAAGFLFRESEMMKALLLLGLAVAGGGGAIFFFFRALRVIWPNKKRPFLPTLP